MEQTSQISYAVYYLVEGNWSVGTASVDIVAATGRPHAAEPVAVRRIVQPPAKYGTYSGAIPEQHRERPKSP